MASLDDILTTQQNGVRALNQLQASIFELCPIWVQAPGSSTANGVAGQVAYDTNYFYVCVATNTWRRAALVTF